MENYKWLCYNKMIYSKRGMEMQSKDIALQTLNKYFGYNSFRSPQDEIIEEILKGRSASVIMPTGGGKSVCYQIPALILNGVAIIITPIIALMQDQVGSLKEMGVSAEYLNSTLSQQKQSEIIHKVLNGQVKLLYVSPERLLNNVFYETVKKMNVSLFAIDESHCVSQWGHSFRTDYLNLGVISVDFPNVPKIALTATANELTRNEIINNLGLTSAKQFVGSFDRPNITYVIESKSQESEQLVDYISENHEEDSGIVYCMTRRRVEEFAKLLQDEGYNAYPYHAGLSIEEREKHLNLFLKNEKVIIVATIAFGMGIDKPNVRFVCHMDLPSSIEAYYQETGRAGRDGEPSVAWMLYGVEDVAKRLQILERSGGDEQHKRLERNNIDTMFSLCEVVSCRRQVLMGYFGDTLDKNCNNCDNCLNPKQTEDASIYVQKALSAMCRTGQIYGVNYIVAILMGKENPRNIANKHNELNVFGLGKDLSESNWKTIFRQLIVMGYIDLNHIYGSLRLTNKGVPILKGIEKIRLSKHIVQKGKRLTQNIVKIGMSLEDEILFLKLKELRMKISKSKNMPPYLIFNDDTLKDMIFLKANNPNKMLKVNGVGDVKLRNYGGLFIEVINKHLSNE